VLNVNAILTAGTYWVEFASGLAAQFAVPSTIAGTRTQAGVNAVQKTVAGGTWAALIDNGNPTGNPAPQDVYFKIDYTTGPCSGTPNPGNTIASVGTVCPLVNFTLSLQNPTLGSGVSYQWQSASASAGPYTNISGATNSTLTTTLTATTFYRAIVTCSGSPGTSTPVQVTLNAAGSCYCVAGANSTAFEKISRVEFNTINNPSTSTAGYENFTAISTTLVKGQVAPITVTISGGFAEDEVRVWIDFNQNGNFTDAGELVYVSAQGVGPHIGNITISPTAVTGPTRMRIRMHDVTLTPNTTPCGNSGFGQVEDYTVNIQPCVQGAITTAPPARSVQCSGNTTFPVVATGSALTYVWQYRVTATSPWLNVPNAAPFSNITTATLGLSNVPASMSGYEFRALVTGPCTATIFSAGAILTVTPLIATVTPASASICTGSIQKITLTNASSQVTSVFPVTAGLPLTVTDNNTVGVSSTSVVSGIPAGAVLTDISVTFNMTHTWVGDLVMNLTSPNGQTLNLIGALNNGNGDNSTDNFTGTIVSSTGVTAMSGAPAPRTGIFKADAFTASIPTIAPTTTNTWTALQTVLNGNWRLAMCDIGGGDVGILTAWSITITYGAPATGVWTSNPATPNTMFTDAAATVPYVAGAQANAIWVNPTVNTSYSVVYSTAAPSSCTSAATTVPITVVTPVSAPTITPATRTACVGGSVSFVAAATGGPATYQWEVSTNGGASFASITGQTSATLTLSALTATMNNNQYRAVISAGPCAGSVTTTAATLTVNPIPVITIAAPVTQLIPGRTTTITATSTTSGLVYTWARNTVATGVTGPTQFATIDSIGTYRATGTLTGVSGCTGTSAALVIGTEASDRLFVYPNPTDGAFQVRLFHATDVATERVVTVWNSNGQMVARKIYTFVRGMSPYYRMDFDLSNLSPGTYLVKATEKRTDRIVSALVVIQ
jgi:subtilisin-like proprotein convertase family protein